MNLVVFFVIFVDLRVFVVAFAFTRATDAPEGAFRYDRRSMFDEACAVIEQALDGGARQQIVAEVSRSRDFRTALVRLRDSMRSNVWKAGATEISSRQNRPDLRRPDAPRRLSRDARLGRHRGQGQRGHHPGRRPELPRSSSAAAATTDAAVLAILLDYYFLHVLALLSLRVWDEGDADANLGRLGQLLDAAAGAGRQRPAVRRQRRNAAADRDLALRDRRARLRQLLAKGEDAQPVAPDERGARPRGEHGQPPAIRLRGDVRERHGHHAQRQRRPTTRGCAFRWRR